MKKFVCVHGHFYQPPRENPWTGEVDAEESAKPFHDWNERINKECYEANTRAPILDAREKIVGRINNFERISFDIGPTLLSWLRRRSPLTDKAILDADRLSVQRRNGHGNAMAQIYNHVIMPLCSRRDKITQVSWGIKDFEFHYRRKPEGLWLSEAAVDHETLKILSDQGILFTVLAPHQASRIRHIGFGHRWMPVPQESIDSRRAYRMVLEGGRHFHLFFYDAPISRAIAFQGLLSNGDQLVQKFLNAFSRRDREQLVSTATDGESFGHHHKFGEMALAYAFKKTEDQSLAKLTNYAEFLDNFGSYWEADIIENSSWSCAHGVERWRSDCGCRLDFGAGKNQKWRQFLREAFDYLKAIVDEVFEKQTDAFLKDPWQARNDYIHVILDNSDKEKRRFLSKNAKRTLNTDEELKCWQLLEAQRHALFMYTSCAWFFDDIYGIEPIHMMKFARKAMELVQPYSKEPIEEKFLKILEQAKSNFAEQGTGADVFKKYVKIVS